MPSSSKSKNCDRDASYDRNEGTLGGPQNRKKPRRDIRRLFEEQNGDSPSENRPPSLKNLDTYRDPPKNVDTETESETSKWSEDGHGTPIDAMKSPPIRTALMKPKLREMREIVQMTRRANEKRRLKKDMDILKVAANPDLYFKKEQEKANEPRREKASQTIYSLKSVLQLKYNPLVVDPLEIQAYLAFLKVDQLVARFLRFDYCYRMADNWLLALVYVYYQRIVQSPHIQRLGMKPRDVKFTRDTFFTLLYVAFETEEDEDDALNEIINWAISESDDQVLARNNFMLARHIYLKALNYRVFVAKHILEEVMRSSSRNPFWHRIRLEWHSGAHRRPFPRYLLSSPYKNQCGLFRGPEYPIWCHKCFSYWYLQDSSRLPEEVWDIHKRFGDYMRIWRNQLGNLLVYEAREEEEERRRKVGREEKLFKQR